VALTLAFPPKRTDFRPFESGPGALPKQACQALPRIRPVHQALRLPFP